MDGKRERRSDVIKIQLFIHTFIDGVAYGVVSHH
jgi:hypothetical protein